ncbi:uncharacterized protein LOC129292379 [Prosopis cineraria]|uniref:uncharacterized protein LOC129292379 n=1 Tax=Prosopis cineraria TaxID=364024 RepID=UPI002410736C|nr:uncharacterized protein LOC129292379 [Prosopis cineraria]
MICLNYLSLMDWIYFRFSRTGKVKPPVAMTKASNEITMQIERHTQIKKRCKVIHDTSKCFSFGLHPPQICIGASRTLHWGKKNCGCYPKASVHKTYVIFSFSVSIKLMYNID